MPIVRTFTPIVAGASRMPYRRFVAYNVVGGVAWGSGVTILGYFLGQVAFVKSNIELILIAIVAVSVIPVAVELLRSRTEHRVRSGPRRPSPTEARPEPAAGQRFQTTTSKLPPSDAAELPPTQTSNVDDSSTHSPPSQ